LLNAGALKVSTKGRKSKQANKKKFKDILLRKKFASRNKFYLMHPELKKTFSLKYGAMKYEV
jgi:hypothetical protein